MRKAAVIRMPSAPEPAPKPELTPWAALGFASERDMLIGDLQEIDQRMKSPLTAAYAVAALSKRKQEIFEQVKLLDAGGDDPDGILDDADDEAWNVGS